MHGAFKQLKNVGFFWLCLGLCLSNQLSCGSGEIDCFDAKDQCNGVWDCQEHGGDELRCGKAHKLQTQNLCLWYFLDIKL